MKPVIASASSSTVRVYSDKEQLSIGTVIGADGFILTVADELKTPIQCRLPDGTTRSATVFGVDQETGLALLKIEANNLNPLSLGDFAEPTLGNWLASVSPDKNPIAIGIVSVLERKISGGGAFIGITMDNDSKGVRILSVVADSPADVSDLFINDIIIKIDGKSVATREELITQMQNYSAGDEVELVVLRQGQEKTFQLVLAPRNKFDQDRSQQDRMGSKLSKRRQGFSLAFQHDSFLQGNECGSPVLDLDGKLIGINISRSGRVSSLALPMSVVLPAIERLKSGQLAPAIINARRIELIQSELDSIAKDLAPLPESLNQFNQNLIQEEAKIEEVKNSQRILEERLKELSEASEKSKKEVEQIQSKITDFERRRARLLKELDELKVGAQ
jgi:S1-C subfamily serine protease